jgi:HSP20 family protein
MPKVDVIERNGVIVVKAEVPGVDKDALEVQVSDTSVTISGSNDEARTEKHGDYYRSEISHGSFSRTFGLPREVDSAKARAAFKDGVLELTLPERPRGHSVKVQPHA